MQSLAPLHVPRHFAVVARNRLRQVRFLAQIYRLVLVVVVEEALGTVQDHVLSLLLHGLSLIQ